VSLTPIHSGGGEVLSIRFARQGKSPYTHLARRDEGEKVFLRLLRQKGGNDLILRSSREEEGERVHLSYSYLTMKKRKWGDFGFKCGKKEGSN